MPDITTLSPVEMITPGAAQIGSRLSYKDRRSPAFRQKLWDTAREFEARVFGPEKVS